MYLFNRYSLMNLLGDGDGGAGTGTSTGDGTSGGSAGGTDGAGAAGVSWDAVKATLPDDLKNDTSLSTIKDFQGLVKGYVHGQKMIGKGNVPIPDAKHATREDWLQVYRKLGAPDKPEDFKFKLPDGVKDEGTAAEFLKSMRETAVKAGIMPWQFEEVFGAFYKHTNDRLTADAAEFKRAEAEDKAALKVAWGAAYDSQVKRANVAFKELVPDEGDRKRLIEDGLGAHPVVMKILAGASKYFKEDTFIGHGEGDVSGVTPAMALKKAKDIQGDKNHPYRNPTHPNHMAAKKEVQDLYKLAFPE